MQNDRKNGESKNIGLVLLQQLFTKAKKCEFLLTEIDLLGVKVSIQGFRMEEKKITEIREWKAPRNVRGIRGFLGFMNFYRRFINKFAHIA